MNFPTDASLTHHPALEIIMLIMRHPDDPCKTLIKIYHNKKPFERKQEVEIDSESHNSIVSLDRRSSIEQAMNRFLVLVLIKPDQMNHELMKIPFLGTTFNYAGIIRTGTVEGELCMCHTMQGNIIVAFYAYSAHLYDENLLCKNKIQLNGLLNVK